MTECWTLRSLLDTEGSREDWRNMLEKEATVEAFDIHDEIASAEIIPDTIGRNDRPGFANIVALSIRMENDVTESPTMTIRAPLGSVFPQDCLGGILINLEEFLTPSQKDSVKMFEPGVEPTACISDEHLLRVELPGGLRAGVIYAFAVKVRNALEETEEEGFWSIEYAKEASAPIPAFSLWVVSGIVITPTQTTRRILASSAEATTDINYVTIDFKTHHEIRPGGRIRIVAPSDGTEEGSFKFIRYTLECVITLQQVSGDRGQLTTLWGSDDVTCIVEEDAKNVANVNIISTTKVAQAPVNVAPSSRPVQSIRSGLLYRVVAVVYNPQQANQQAAIWGIETYDNTWG